MNVDVWYSKARETIQRLVAKIQGGPLDNDGPGTTGQIELMVPGGKVGLIIGKSGETIKQIQVCDSLQFDCVATHALHSCLVILIIITFTF